MLGIAEQDAFSYGFRLGVQLIAGMIEGLCFGIIGALMFGIGMCFFLDVFAGVAWLTAILMICGTLLMIPAYPIYRRIARKTKAALTPEILLLSEEIMKS